MQPLDSTATPTAAANLVAAVSADRFSLYFDARRQDVCEAFKLYEWNAELCAAFYVPLQAIEVALRNVCHRELANVFGPDWPFEPKFLGIDVRLHKSIERAKNIARSGLKKSKKTLDTPHVVAACEFRFWTMLHASDLSHSIWVPCRSMAFSEFATVNNGQKITRHDAAELFDKIRHFRNRAFHHEPIFRNASLHSDDENILRAASWMLPDLRAWVALRSVQCHAMIVAGPPT